MLKINQVYAHKSNYYDHTAYGGKRKNVKGICWHTTEGYNSEDWFKRPEANSSCDYLVKANGHILQIVPKGAIAWTQGTKVEHRNLIPDWYSDDLYGSYNICFLGVEVEGFHNRKIPKIQFDACVELAEYLHEEYDIPYDEEFYWRHSQLNKYKRDPSIAYEPNDILKAVVAKATRTTNLSLEARVTRLEKQLQQMKDIL